MLVTMKTRRRRAYALLALSAAVTTAAPQAAAAVPRAEFAGNCRIFGSGVLDPVGERFAVSFEGLCTGLLNGLPVVDQPVSVSVAGTSTAVAGVPVAASGTGTAVLRDHRTRAKLARFRVAVQRVGLVEHIFDEHGGHGIVAVTPTSPPDGNHLTLAGTMQTLTPLRS
jgi:hypothetical protein